MYYNEYDDSPTDRLLKQRKKRKLKTRVKIIIGIICMIIVIILVAGNTFRIKSIHITGEYSYNQEEVLDHISISKKSYYPFLNTSKIEKEIKEILTVETVKVTCDLLGHVNINLKETYPIAYSKINNKIYVINNIGKIYEETDKTRQNELQSLPFVDKFTSTELLEDFAKEYKNVQDVIKNEVSDIILDPQPGDQTRLKMILLDNNIIDIRIEDISTWLSDKNKFDLNAWKTEHPEGYMTFSFYKNYLYYNGEKQS